MTFTNDQEYIMEKAIKAYGSRNQMVKAIEELAELTKALTKYMLYVDKMPTEVEELKLIEDVIEETADVLIMAEQVAMMFDEEAVKEVAESKLNRLAERMRA